MDTAPLSSAPPPLPTRQPQTARQKITLGFRFIGFFLGTLFVVRVLLGSITPHVEIPPQENPPNNAYPLYLQAGQQTYQDLDRIWSAISLRPKEAQQWDLARRTRLRDAHTSELSLARRGFSLPYSDLSSSRTAAEELPHYKKFCTLALLFVLDGDVKLEQKNISGAAQSYSDAIVFGNALTHGAPLTGLETAMSCQKRGRARLWKLLPAMDAKTAHESLRRLNNPAFSDAEAYAQALTEEKYTVQTEIVAFHQETPRFSPMNAIWGRSKIMSNGTNYMDVVIADARTPYSLHKETPLPSDMLTPILLPMVDRAHFGSVAGDAQNALLMTSLAIQAYRAEHSGAAPETLSALVPAYLPAVPRDPFTYPAAPIGYTNGAKIMLWSVGPDNTNNQGTPTCDYKPNSGPAIGKALFITTPQSKGDIVAGVNTRYW